MKSSEQSWEGLHLYNGWVPLIPGLLVIASKVLKCLLLLVRSLRVEETAGEMTVSHSLSSYPPEAGLLTAYCLQRGLS